MGWKTIGALGVVTGIALAACGNLTAPELEGDLLGSWTWVRSVGGIAGMTLTPASTGETMTLRFPREDSVEVIRNGVLDRGARFTLTGPDRDGVFIVAYSSPIFGWDEQALSLPTPDTLSLVDGCCDGFAYTFVRAP